MKDNNSTTLQVASTEMLNARNSLELMVLQCGNIRIETLGQLLALTKTVEIAYSHLCARRLCN